MIQAMQELFKDSFSKLVSLDDNEWQLIKSFIQHQEYKKGELLCAISQTEQYLSIVQEGICHGFYPKDSGKISVAFMFETDYVSAYYSFLTQRPSAMGIEALTDVRVISISKKDLDHLCDISKKAERIGRLNAERLYRRKEEREISLLTMTATERYQELLNRDPELFQLIPLKYIASYLGIQPESLSRIRKQLSQS